MSATHERTDRKPNRLAKEASPYLLQHAHNPVEWFPWGEEALAESRRRDAPILLSIGYSACHWCHVMERESFEDAAIAKLMNEHFVCIKVDREERPDLDQIYQLVVQLMGRSGGWPLTVFLTPSRQPFFAGTYFPPVDRYGMPGFPKILAALAEAYRERRGEIDEQAGELTKALAEVGRGDSDGTTAYAPSPELLERVSAALMKRFDDVHGGFGSKPKFPNTMPLEVLLRRGVLEEDGVARDAVRLALESMRQGGIWDHLGGGFHRYSTDERWLVPHFEKMLYDNALLLRAYVDGHRVFAEPLFESTARDIVQWVTREMTDASGGYYASQDADSLGEDGVAEEGKFFVWSPNGVRQAMGEDELAAKASLLYFGVTRDGNFDEHGRVTFMTVLHENRPITAVAAQLLDTPVEDVREALARAKKRLFEVREQRPKPFRDEKVLTSWGALMIGAMAEASAALREPSMLASAEHAFAFVEEKLVTWSPDRTKARALRLTKGEVVKGPGFLDDHAYLANAALDLYEVTGEPSRVALARALVAGMIDAFWEEGEGFFFTPKDGESLITRPLDPYDNAVPSGASMACRALLRLGALVDVKYTELAEKEVLRLAPSAVANPMGFGQALCELDRLVRGSVDVVLVGPRDDARTKALAEAVFARWLPNRTVAWLDPSNEASRAACALLAEGKEPKSTPVAYVCRGRTCSLPVATPGELGELLA